MLTNLMNDSKYFIDSGVIMLKYMYIKKKVNSFNKLMYSNKLMYFNIIKRLNVQVCGTYKVFNFIKSITTQLFLKNLSSVEICIIPE